MFKEITKESSVRNVVLLKGALSVEVSLKIVVPFQKTLLKIKLHLISVSKGDYLAVLSIVPQKKLKPNATIVAKYANQRVDNYAAGKIQQLINAAHLKIV